MQLENANPSHLVNFGKEGDLECLNYFLPLTSAIATLFVFHVLHTPAAVKSKDFLVSVQTGGMSNRGKARGAHGLGVFFRAKSFSLRGAY